MPAKNNAVLIVEDSATFSSLLRRRIDKTLGLKSVVAATRAEAVEVLEKRRDDFCVTLLDLNLPDASDGEILDSVLGYGIPSIVFTGSYSDVLREKVLARNVVDYVPKESVHDLEYLLKLITRLRKNRSTKILVVDDSQTTRMFILNLLRLRNFQSLEAESGAVALELLKLNPDIKLVITDYNMPGIDGFELTQRIRKCHSRDKLAIIGLSAHGSGTLSAQFLKKGANDFLTKPFVNEEFFCRIEHNLEIMEYIEEIQFLNRRDYLTSLGNRRLFFEDAPKLVAAARKEEKPVSVTMLDIDHFKHVNDTFGHDGGDAALKHLALILREMEAPRTVVARFGGEEFCIIFVDDAGDASQRIETLRRRIEASPVPWHKSFSVTASLGHLRGAPQELESMLARADQLLYQAKQTGRNRVVEELS